jgi:hypothetical protein
LERGKAGDAEQVRLDSFPLCKRDLVEIAEEIEVLFHREVIK